MHSLDETYSPVYRAGSWEGDSPVYSPYRAASPPLPSTPRSAVRRVGEDAATQPQAQRQLLDSPPLLAARESPRSFLFGQEATSGLDKPPMGSLNAGSLPHARVARVWQSLGYDRVAEGSPDDGRLRRAKHGPGAGSSAPLWDSEESPEDPPTTSNNWQSPDCVMLSGDPRYACRSRRKGRGTGDEDGAGNAATTVGWKLVHRAGTRDKENACGPGGGASKGKPMKGPSVSPVCSSGVEGQSLSKGQRLPGSARHPLADLKHKMGGTMHGLMWRPVSSEEGREKQPKFKARAPPHEIIDLSSP